MTKTKYQESAMKYAKEYLERLLDMEDVVGRNVEKKLDKLVEEKMQKYMRQPFGKTSPPPEEETPPKDRSRS
ncbi:MAG: hypothetical protein IJV33_10750 [Bacteroidaceae bacterium]|nr:hypothetical protein [Bacteroidaceae bacterium]